MDLKEITVESRLLALSLETFDPIESSIILKCSSYIDFFSLKRAFKVQKNEEILCKENNEKNKSYALQYKSKYIFNKNFYNNNNNKKMFICSKPAGKNNHSLKITFDQQKVEHCKSLQISKPAERNGKMFFH